MIEKALAGLSSRKAQIEVTQPPGRTSVAPVHWAGNPANCLIFSPENIMATHKTGRQPLTSFRFVHTADIHLDSPLKGLAGHEGSAAERIRTATREAFDNLIGQAIDEKASFFIIAGDLYDGDWRDYQTGLFFVGQMGRLDKARIPAFVLYGNHDAESQITRRLILPENVKTFSTRKPETFELKQLGVALHGHSFRHRDIGDNLVPAYPEPIAGLFNIGVLHTGLGGIGGHANYAPCALDDLVNKGYEYWALGHVHQGSILHERPHVVFPGNLQGRHIHESGPKGAYLITVDDGEVAELVSLHADVVRWTLVSISVDGCDRTVDVVDRVRDAIEEAVSREADGRLLACRVEIKGRTEIHDRLLTSVEHLLAEARSAALGLGEEAAWVERVVVATEPVLDPATLRAREDALGELQRMLGDAGGDSELLEQLENDIGELVRKLPHEVRADAEDAILKAAIDGDYAGLIREASCYLTARITAEGQ
jgi:exonuclease SbcD